MDSLVRAIVIEVLPDILKKLSSPEQLEFIRKRLVEVADHSQLTTNEKEKLKSWI
jgi:hypothetical protein